MHTRHYIIHCELDNRLCYSLIYKSDISFLSGMETMIGSIFEKYFLKASSKFSVDCYLSLVALR